MAEFTPHLLTGDHKDYRIGINQKLVANANGRVKILKSIITEDGTWIYASDVETKITEDKTWVYGLMLKPRQQKIAHGFMRLMLKPRQQEIKREFMV